MNRIIAGLIITLLPCAALAQDIPAATDQVPIEEYVPKVIIEGKWGTGPGEFGYDGFNPVDFSPNSAVFGPDDLIHPRSLAVDSKGSIYILDVANNRIQKFNKNGKQLADLKVDSWNGYDLDPETGWSYKVKGINIVIDSKDNLYYYLKRVKDGKESGEVWQFRNDKLVKKTEINTNDIDDPKNPRAVSPDRHPARDLMLTDIKKEETNKYTATEKEGKKTLRFKLGDGEELPGFGVYDKKERIWKIGIKRNNKYWNRIYNSAGIAVKEVESPNLFLSKFSNQYADAKGNYYCLDIKGSLITVWKYELVRINK